MRRIVASASLSIAALVTPVAIATPASATELQVTAVSRSVVSAPTTCNPPELRAKAQAHDQKAKDYDDLREKELSGIPNPKKVAHYVKMSREHKQKADEYRAEAKQCEDADSNL
jgi:hypothetical protein